MSSKKKYTILLLVIVAILIVVAIFANRWRNYVEFDKITVTGNYTLSRQEILSFAKLSEDSVVNIDELNLKTIQDRTSKNPEVKKVYISKVPPSELNIEIIEKRPVALLNLDNELKLIDEELEVFSFKNYQKIYDLPVVTGYKTGGVQVLDSLKNVNNLKTALFIIMNAYQKSKTLYNMISEINIADSSKIIVYSNDKSAKFYFPKYSDRNIADKSYQKELINTLVKFSAFHIQIPVKENIDYVDLRFKEQAVVKFN